MARIENVNVLRRWQECSNGGGESMWSTLYATMNPNGDIVISGYTHRALGEPDSYVLLFDAERSVIGLRPARKAVEKNAFPARSRGKYGGQRIRAHRLCRDFGILVDATVRFHKCQIDNNGVLILDLNLTKSGSRGRPMPPKTEDGLCTDSIGEYRLDSSNKRRYTKFW